MKLKNKVGLEPKIKIVRASFRGRPAYHAVVGSMKSEPKVYQSGDGNSRAKARREASKAGKELSRLQKGVQDRGDND